MIPLKIMILHEPLGFLLVSMILPETREVGILRCPCAELICLTVLFRMLWGAYFGVPPPFSCFYMQSINFHEITMDYRKNMYFALLVRNSIFYPERACGCM